MCELVQAVDFPEHDIFIRKIVATHCDQSVITDGAVDLEKPQPVLFAMNDRSYYRLGERFARDWSIGNEL